MVCYGISGVANITFAKLINNGNDMYIMRKRRSSQYQENCLLHFNSILINYKLVLEELDVLQGVVKDIDNFGKFLEV